MVLWPFMIRHMLCCCACKLLIQVQSKYLGVTVSTFVVFILLAWLSLLVSDLVCFCLILCNLYFISTECQHDMVSHRQKTFLRGNFEIYYLILLIELDFVFRDLVLFLFHDEVKYLVLNGQSEHNVFTFVFFLFKTKPLALLIIQSKLSLNCHRHCIWLHCFGTNPETVIVASEYTYLKQLLVIIRKKNSSIIILNYSVSHFEISQWFIF